MPDGSTDAAPSSDAGEVDGGSAPDADAWIPVSRVDRSCDPECGIEIVNRYPHDPAAFTQGLSVRGDVLYEGTGLFGASSLRRVDLNSGTILQSTPLDRRYFGEGITLWQDRIIQLTWQDGLAIVRDLDTFSELRRHRYPTEGWGLTHDGSRLIMSDGSASLYFRDPETFEVLSTIEVRGVAGPIDQINELEYVEGQVFANVWTTDRVLRISPQDGRVVGTVDMSSLPHTSANVDDVLNGIAYEPEEGRLYVTGKRWPELFEVRLVPR